MRRASRLLVSLVRFLLVTVLAFVLLGGAAALVALGLAYVHGARWDQFGYLIVGLSCGLITWLFVAVFHLRHETQELAFSQQEHFVAEAKAILQEMGYSLTSEHSGRLTFRPGFHAFLFGGGIQVQLDGHLAKITGPKLSLERFRRFYRWQHHVQRVQKVLLDQRRCTDVRLKRVELSLRLDPDQFESVKRNVIAPLQEDGEVICELNLLVTSNSGIREEVLEFQIREWLSMKGISFDLHRDLVQFIETAPTEEAETLAV